MKRFYIKKIGEHITVVHRPTHQIIMFGDLSPETGKKLKQLIKMTTEEFYKELNSLGLKFKTTKSIQDELDKEKEDWYEKAWLSTTYQALKHFKIKLDSIPEEEVPLELIKQLQKEAKTGWDIKPKEEKKEAPEEQEKPKKVLKKKTKKLPKKVSNEKVVTLGGYKDLKELEEAYSGGELSTRDYIKLKRKLS